jgi:hypothetical protein
MLNSSTTNLKKRDIFEKEILQIGPQNIDTIFFAILHISPFISEINEKYRYNN